MRMFALNLSLILQPCVWVATTVVSLMNDRLSPKKEPPTTMAVSNATLEPVEWAMPTAIGVRAAMVPTLVPTLRDMKHAARNSPPSSILAGSMDRVRLTVASMLPISFADFANAPASTKIHIMSMMFFCPAPRLYVSMRFSNDMPRDMAMAYMLESMNATVIGSL